MSLYKRNDSPRWWVKISHGGKTIQRSTGADDKSQAQEYHDKLKASLWEQQRLGVKPRRAWKEAVVRWLVETSDKATHQEDVNMLRWLDPLLGPLMLDELTLDVRCSRNPLGGSARSPCSKSRRFWVSCRHISAIVVLFALATGLRQSNVVGLEWSHVDLETGHAWVSAGQSKNRRPIAVPLNATALEVLRRQLGKHRVRVFTYAGKPLGSANTLAWRRALKRAGIENFRWHDLRHT